MEIDLNIVDGDLFFDDVLQPAQLNDADVIAQDIKHRILESGYLVQMIGLRNINAKATILTELELIVEQDDRLVPGSIYLTKNIDGSINVKAETKEFGNIRGSNDA